MKRHFLCCLLLCIAGTICAESLLWGQGPTPVIPPPTASLDAYPAKIHEEPVAFTPLEAAQKLYLMGRFDDAVERYNAAISTGTDAAVAYAGLARAYLKLKKPDEAYTAAQKAVELDPLLPTARSALGEVDLRRGSLYDAQTEFLFPFKENQVDARSYLGLSRLYRATGYFKKAKVAIDQAYKLDPKDPDISGAWINTRPRSEQMKAMETAIASSSNYYSRPQKAGLEHRLAVMKDEEAHPERTCSLADPPESVELPLVPAGDTNRPNPFAGLAVAVNGKVGKLVVSTGDAELAISDKIAEKAGVQEIVRTDMDGLGSENPPESYIGFARSIKIGSLTFQDCYVTVVEHAVHDSFFSKVDGTVGLEIFSRYLLDLDMPRAKLTLRPLPRRPAAEDADSARMDAEDPDAASFHDRYIAPEMRDWPQIYRFGHGILIPAAVNDSPPMLFGVSTTSYMNDLAADVIKKWASVRADVSSSIYSTDGKIDTQWTGSVRLTFAGLYFDAPTEPAFDLKMWNDDLGTETSGELGFQVLHNLRIILDYRDDAIHFEVPGHKLN
jgi:tetratricopeptide (TPR) repeat protein